MHRDLIADRRIQAPVIVEAFDSVHDVDSSRGAARIRFDSPIADVRYPQRRVAETFGHVHRDMFERNANGNAVFVLPHVTRSRRCGRQPRRTEASWPRRRHKLWEPIERQPCGAWSKPGVHGLGLDNLEQIGRHAKASKSTFFIMAASIRTHEANAASSFPRRSTRWPTRKCDRRRQALCARRWTVEVRGARSDLPARTRRTLWP